MSDSNNVISFQSKKALRDAEPAFKEVAKFKHVHEANLDWIEDRVNELIDDMIEEFGILPETIQFPDYAMLVESAMSLVMRAQGFEHPLIQPVADEFFKD